MSVYPIVLPPLRERREDTLLLAHVVHRKKPTTTAAPDPCACPAPCWKRSKPYEWPGNVRELQNVIERAMIGFDRVTCLSFDWDIRLGPTA